MRIENKRIDKNYQRRKNGVWYTVRKSFVSYIPLSVRKAGAAAGVALGIAITVGMPAFADEADSAAVSAPAAVEVSAPAAESAPVVTQSAPVAESAPAAVESAPAVTESAPAAVESESTPASESAAVAEGGQTHRTTPLRQRTVRLQTLRPVRTLFLKKPGNRLL